MCIGSNSVNQAQDLMFVTKFEDFPNSLLPSVQKKWDPCSNAMPLISISKGKRGSGL